AGVPAEANDAVAVLDYAHRGLTGEIAELPAQMVDVRHGKLEPARPAVEGVLQKLDNLLLLVFSQVRRVNPANREAVSADIDPTIGRLRACLRLDPCFF